MGKFLLFLMFIFTVIFIIQQSRLVETKRVMDVRLGVSIEESHLNWDNLFKYLHDIPVKIKKMIPHGTAKE